MISRLELLNRIENGMIIGNINGNLQIEAKMVEFESDQDFNRAKENKEDIPNNENVPMN